MNRIIFNQCLYCHKKQFSKKEMNDVMATGQCHRCHSLKVNREALDDNTPAEFMSDELVAGIIKAGL